MSPALQSTAKGESLVYVCLGLQLRKLQREVDVKGYIRFEESLLKDLFN